MEFLRENYESSFKFPPTPDIPTTFQDGYLKYRAINR